MLTITKYRHLSRHHTRVYLLWVWVSRGLGSSIRAPSVFGCSVLMLTNGFLLQFLRLGYYTNLNTLVNMFSMGFLLLVGLLCSIRILHCRIPGRSSTHDFSVWKGSSRRVTECDRRRGGRLELRRVLSLFSTSTSLRSS